MNESYEMDVPVGSAFMFDKVKCKHCGERIVLINYSMGPSWTHQPAGASFQDGTHQYCHRTVAEPDMTDQRPHSRACGWRKHEHGTECSTNCPTCHGAAT